LAYVQLAFLSLLWGFSFLLIKIASQSFDWIGYACGRAGVAALALAALALTRRVAWPRSAKVWGQMAAMSLAGQVGPFLLFGVAAHLITSADMALMMGSAPIFTFALARMFGLGEVWNARAAAGLALGLVGVALSLGSPFAAGGGGAAHAGLGRTLALVAALGYAGSALLSRPVSRAVGAAMAATGSMAISGALLAAAELVAGGIPSLAVLAAKPAGPLAALVALGLFNTGLAYFVYFRLIETAGATFAALNNYIVPCIGVIAGALALGEPVRPAAWIGLACVLVSVAVTGSAAGEARKIASLPMSEDTR
jgi:drug/metabolite transporter (DMT)-like permease